MKKLTQEEFIKRVTKIFQEKLDFSKSVYTIANNKIKAICPKHGEFEKLAWELMKGRGCPKCGTEKGAKKITLTQDEFIKRSIKAHGDTYDLTPSIYIGTNDKIKAICKKHGEFEQIAFKFMEGRGCQKCSKEIIASKYRKTTEQRIEEAIKIHGNKYDYSKFNGNGGSFNKTTIICKKHGEFEQTISDHINGHHGCQKCKAENHGGIYKYQSKKDLEQIKPAFIYFYEIKNDNEKFFKVGVTKNPKKRNKELNNQEYYEVKNIKLIETNNMFEAVDLEQLILKEVEQYIPEHHFVGHTECFLMEHRKE
jgi:hypothetical protein